VCLAAAQRAGSQSLRDVQPTARMNSGKMARAGNIRRSLNTGAIPNESPVLCFQSGIGWRRVPTGKLNGPRTPGSCSSDKIEASGSAAGVSSQSAYAQPNSAKQGLSPEVDMEDVSTDNHAQKVPFAHSTSVNSGTLAALPGNALFSRAMGAASGRRMMALKSMPSGSPHLSAGSKPGASFNPVGDLQFHAYISSIVLRRMIRTAPDLQTRIKLQGLQKKLSNQSYISTAPSRESQPMKARLKHHHDRASYPSPTQGGHSPATDSNMALSSLTHP
jgi:hypothetical protein